MRIDIRQLPVSDEDSRGMAKPYILSPSEMLLQLLPGFLLVKGCTKPFLECSIILSLSPKIECIKKKVFIPVIKRHQCQPDRLVPGFFIHAHKADVQAKGSRIPFQQLQQI